MHFINTGPGNVHVTWTPDDEHNDGPAAIAVAVDPDRFKVIDRTAVDVSVRPTRPGRFRRALGFRAVNCDRDVVVHVRGTAETAPEVDARPVAFASTVCTGVPSAYPVRFRVKSSGPFSVRRRLYAYDASGPLRPQADGVQTFGPYGGATADNGTATMTTLSFPTPVATQVRSWGVGRGGRRRRFPVRSLKINNVEKSEMTNKNEKINKNKKTNRGTG